MPLETLGQRLVLRLLNETFTFDKGIIVLYGWKVIVQEQNEIVGELHIPRENFPFPRS